MIKKISLFIFAIILSNCAGYNPIYTSSGSNIYVKNIEHKDNTFVSKQIAKKINSIYSNANNLKSVSIILNSSNDERILSKDNQGNPLIFEIKIVTEMEVYYEESLQKFIYTQTKSFNNQENKFDLKQYKKNLEKDLIENILEKIVFNLNQI